MPENAPNVVSSVFNVGDVHSGVVCQPVYVADGLHNTPSRQTRSVRLSVTVSVSTSVIVG